MRRSLALLLLVSLLPASCITVAQSPPPEPAAVRRPGPRSEAPIAQPTRTATRPGGAASPAEDWRGRYSVDVVRVEQRIWNGDDVALGVQLALTPQHPDVFLDELPPVRRFVTTDGFELTHPPQNASSVGAHGVASHGILLGRAHRGLRDLEVDVRIVHVDEWGAVSSGPLDGERREAQLGPFEVWVTADAGRVAVSLSGAGEVGRREAPLRWTFARAAEFLIVTDASGRELVRGGGGGSGGALVTHYATAHFPDPGEPIAYPVTVRLRVPTRYRLEPKVLTFRNLKLPAPY